MNRFILWTSICVVLLASCSDYSELDNPIGDAVGYNGVELAVKASYGKEATRTVVASNGTTIMWSPGDAINMFYGSGSAGKFTEQSLSGPATYAEFNGVLNVVTGSNETGTGARSFWGVYPYNEANTCDGSSVTMTIPSIQLPAENTFANGLNPSIATGLGLDLVFYNVGSWFIFTVESEGITSATLTGNNGEDLVGKVKVTMDSEGHPSAAIINGEKSVTMNAPEGGFTPGVQYYMVILPQTLQQGYTLTLSKGDQTASFVNTNSSEFIRSWYRRKQKADSGLEFRDVMYDTYLTFEAIEDCVVSFRTTNRYDRAAFYISLDGGVTWSSRSTGYSGSSETTAQLSAGEKMLVKADHANSYFDSVNIYKYFSIEGGDCYVYGNIMSLVACDSFYGRTRVTSSHFRRLFSGCTHLKSHPTKDLLLPATDLDEACYMEMFQGSGLTRAPKLPAIVLAKDCYYAMFQNCKSLVDVPDLEATSLAYGCCQYMFRGCTSLATAPVLPATTLVTFCYHSMFEDCSSLSYIKCLAKDISANNSTTYWVRGVASKGSFVRDDLMISWTEGVHGFPQGWIVLSESGTIPVACVTLDKSYLSLTVGDIETLIAYVEPTYASYRDLIWSSNMPDVVAVTGEGVIEAKSAGSATITVTTADGSKTATCAVTVTNPVVHVESVSLNKTSLSLTVGGSETLQATVSPSTASNTNVTWSSSNTSVATVSNGTVIAQGVGTATITVTTSDGSKKATCSVTVTIPVTGISLDKTSLTLPSGTTSTLVASVLPSNATNKNISWSSSNTSVATVSGGVITAIAPGTSTITAKTSDGNYKADCSVTVKLSDPVAVDLGLSVKWSDRNFQAPSETSAGTMTTFYEATGFRDDISLAPSDILSKDIVSESTASEWRMPTKEEFQELLDQCVWTEETRNGVKGYKISNNGASIFLPLSGLSHGSTVYDANSHAWYWLHSYEKKTTSYLAYRYVQDGLHGDFGSIDTVDGADSNMRYTIRPVKVE